MRLADLVGEVAWLSGNEPGSEGADLYADMRREFGLTASVDGPDFWLDHLIDAIAATPDRYPFTGDLVRAPWHPGIVRLPVVDPTPGIPVVDGVAAAQPPPRCRGWSTTSPAGTNRSTPPGGGSRR